MSILKSWSQKFLFTDFYQLTMSQVYFDYNIHEIEVQFDYFFRSYPNYGSHQAGFCIFAGLETFFEWLSQAKPEKQEIEFLKNLKNNSLKPLFKKNFLTWLKNIEFSTLNIEAIPEGKVVHPHVPIVSIKGPFALAQIIETPLLNILNYQTLIATKAARIKEAAKGQIVMDFGLRRAQGFGGNAGTRGAIIGGVDFSSNTGTCFCLGLTPKGTHAHSLVQAFIALGYSEEEAFWAFAKTFPDSCILLIDTINTLESGLPNAIKTFKKLKTLGKNPIGIRIDSGDLAYLAVQCYKELKKAGFEDCVIVLSNQLDELVIHQILTQIEQEAQEYNLNPKEIISKLVFGVGTRLITSAGSCSLDGVYKLTGVKTKNSWQPALKISDSPAKTLIPGDKKTYRLIDTRGKAMADLICLNKEHPLDKEKFTIFHPQDSKIFRILNKKDILKADLLQKPIQQNGKIVYEFPSLIEIKKQREQDLKELDQGVRRLINPHIYHVSLSEKLCHLREKLIKNYRNKTLTVKHSLD
ncbi:nicotinate phosphoribosyltransferase [Desulfonauticus submarinus]